MNEIMCWSDNAVRDEIERLRQTAKIHVAGNDHAEARNLRALANRYEAALAARTNKNAA